MFPLLIGTGVELAPKAGGSAGFILGGGIGSINVSAWVLSDKTSH